MIQVHGVQYASILATRTLSLGGGGGERRIKPAQNKSGKGRYEASTSGGERVTISNFDQSNTIVCFVPFCFRLSIASGDGQSQDGPCCQHSPTS